MAAKKAGRNKSRGAAKGDHERADGTKVSITARDIQITFFAFFLIFAGAGYMRGRIVRNSPERLRMYLAENVQNDTNLLQLVKSSNGRRRIMYTCPNKQYWYEIDDDKIHKEPLSLPAPGAVQSFEPAITRDDVFFSTFLIGTLSAWTVKDVVSYVGVARKSGAISSKLKVVAAAIAGVAVGFEVGYWLALRSTPSCDSGKYDALLGNSSEWRLIAAGILTERIKNAEEGVAALGHCEAGDRGVRRAQDDRMNNALLKFTLLKDRASELGYSCSSADFDSLDEFLEVKSDYLKVCSPEKESAH